ncbi:MAG TPA: glycosyltransferase family 39 protein [Bacteroidales bacterium]|nr:glycosyltransferase family 39 protein [Bacteroidales bacterium]HPS16234.1 glycosyltransferase family 39 protein [Bacteroidales bacterium]
MSSEIKKKFCNKIEFWIVIFFLIRLIGITNPPIEIGHNWRQATGLMVSRNFFETNSNILYPRIDDNEGGTGIIGMEFPIMNYIYSLIAKLFGYTHWYGRLINLIVSSIGIFFFYKIIKKYFDHKIAFSSAFCLIGSIWFAFSRKMMPDTFCISLMFIGIYYGTEYLEKGRYINIFLYLLFSSLGILSKIPAGIYFIVFIPLFFTRTNPKQKIILGLTTIIPLILTYTWYFIWNPYVSSKFGIWYNSGSDIQKGFYEVSSNIYMALEKFFISSFCSYIFISFFIFGIFLMLKKQNKRLIYVFTSILLIFIIYIFKSGSSFTHHSYYIIPFVPVMALVAGYSISQIKNKWLFIFIIFFGITESIANQQHDFFNKKTEMYKLELESIADSVSDKKDLIVINGNGNPQQIYLTHRKGWNCVNKKLSDSLFIEEIALQGCKYIFVNKHDYKEYLNYKIVFENYDYTVYEINSEKEYIEKNN